MNRKEVTPRPLNLKAQYQKNLEIAYIISLLILSILFYSFRSFKPAHSHLKTVYEDAIITVDIPLTKQLLREPPPAIPIFPVASEDPDISDEVTINYDDINIAILSATPPPHFEEEDEIIEFIAVQEKPEIIKKVSPHYPELARKAGIEGLVVVKIVIDKNGDVETAEILKSVPMLDDAALEAAMHCKFKPGKQRDKFVKVRISIPFQFKLK